VVYKQRVTVASADVLRSQRERRVADAALVGVTLLWSTSFALIKGAMGDVSPILLTGLRFAITCALLWPLLLGVRASARAWLDGIALGGLLFASYATQVTGLRYTSAGNSAFVTATCTLMVPLADFLLRGRRPAAPTLLGLALAMFGLYLLVDPHLDRVNRGDLWTLACAVIYAVYMVRLDVALARGPYQVVLYGQLAAAAMLGLCTAPLLERPHLALTWISLRALGIVSVGATAGALYLQNRFQGHTTPTRAAIIFTAEPVFAAGFAYWLLGEVLPLRGYLGGVIVVTGILLSELL
jgi:drug/metabolite transporter (DMT)-like permease